MSGVIFGNNVRVFASGHPYDGKTGTPIRFRGQGRYDVRFNTSRGPRVATFNSDQLARKQ